VFSFFYNFQQLLKIIITVKEVVCQELFSLFLYFSANAENLKIMNVTSSESLQACWTPSRPSNPRITFPSTGG